MKLFFTCIIGACTLFNTSFAQVTASDSLSLVDLYNSTSGGSWTHNTNWLSTAPVGSWYGVSIVFSHVTAVNLINNNLSGTIPSSVGNLDSLSYLRLDSNKLTGSIPATIGNLSHLVFLTARGNQLNGPLPTTFASMDSLQRLDLFYNQIPGSIPSQLGSALNLNYLDLSGNNLSGTIPPELGNLSKVTYFNLNSNQLTGSIPTVLGNLSSDIYFDLAANQLSGAIPSELGNLSNLQILSLDNNAFTGSIPTTLANLTNLFGISLTGNQLTGSIPPGFGNITGLHDISLFNNQLTGPVPSTFANLTNLRTLLLSNNKLSGTIPSFLGNLTNLAELYLYQNQFTGTIPTSLGNLSNMQYLLLGQNQLTGTIPSELGNLTNAIWLLMDGNQLTGSIPSSFGNLNNLQLLGVSANELSGSIPPEINNLSSNLILYINNNFFTFDQMEGIAQKFPNAYYVMQADIPLHVNGNTLSVSAGGTLANDTFRLYKNNVLAQTQIGDSVFTTSGTANYSIAITNAIATELTLYTDTLAFSALPLTLLDFAGTQQNNFALLKWKTTNEVNTAVFNIQRSTDGTFFTNVGSVNANNLVSVNDYSFTDNVARLNTSVVYYRLQMTDKDGLFTYSNVISIHINAADIFTIMPNPAHDYIVINAGIASANTILIITDDNGRLCMRKQLNAAQQQINISALAKGTYNASIIQAGKIATQKLVIQ